MDGVFVCVCVCVCACVSNKVILGISSVLHAENLC